MSLGPQSAFALHAALGAMETTGIECVLTIKVPKNPKDFLDITVQL